MIVLPFELQGHDDAHLVKGFRQFGSLLLGLFHLVQVLTSTDLEF